ncbi:hypothetical protein HUW62_14680 [Myxococcus sp. AM011]|uniref:imm11 family protein n=1 Tax=Myxococcus sp. AM011 TaxID=2745200 RepID=UPI001595FC5B|nr:DUF1629 domain-containing protein [Myxococcus sp. AM011]NVJ22464.1 hypothetical protein [Myxococcus sp. AM011]
MFFRLEPDIYATAGIREDPSLPGFGTTFLGGARIIEPLPRPLIFESNFTQANPPKAFLGASIPVWSADLVELLRRIGVDNFECFEATIQGQGTGAQWRGYFAINVLGLVAAADMSKSRYTEIMSSPGGTPFAGFTELVVDGKKARPFDLFRLAENMGTLLASERVIDALQDHPRTGGWGISAIEVEES